MKKEKIVLSLISLDQETQVVVTNHAKRKIKKKIMTENSKLSNFKFVTLMDPLKNVKANEIVP
jgi:hypothetical protein